MKLLVKLKKKLRLSAISCLKNPMVRILYFVGVFLNGINGYLKAERTLKMTEIPVDLSPFQLRKQ